MKTQKIYFQTQSALSSDCGVCAINNMLGSKIYDNNHLVKICKNLSEDFINPYKSIFGGDFDVTAIIIAFEQIGCSVRWLKKNQQVKDILANKQLIGILINNEQSSNKIFRKLLDKSGRHWTCIRKMEDQYILLDSKQKKPKYFTNKVDTQNFLHQSKQKGATIFVIQLIKQNKEYEKKQLTISLSDFQRN